MHFLITFHSNVNCVRPFPLTISFSLHGRIGANIITSRLGKLGQRETYILGSRPQSSPKGQSQIWTLVGRELKVVLLTTELYCLLFNPPTPAGVYGRRWRAGKGWLSLG